MTECIYTAWHVYINHTNLDLYGCLVLFKLLPSFLVLVGRSNFITLKRAQRVDTAHLPWWSIWYW